MGCRDLAHDATAEEPKIFHLGRVIDNDSKLSPSHSPPPYSVAQCL
jgi:hypothetical protein